MENTSLEKYPPVPEKDSSKDDITKAEKITKCVSFKEETNVAGNLPEIQKKALADLKQLIQDSLNNHQFKTPPKQEEEKNPKTLEEAKVTPEEAKVTPEEAKVTPEEAKVTSEEAKVTPEEAKVVPDEAKATSEEAKAISEETKTTDGITVSEVEETMTYVVVTEDDGAKTVEAIEETIVAVATSSSMSSETVAVRSVPPEEVSIWGIPLLQDDRTDSVLLKFLRARDFKVKEAFVMIREAVRWRESFGIEKLLEEDLGTELEKAVFTDGFDKEGHPVCYNVYGEFQSKNLYKYAFSDEEKRVRFLRWRVQFLEKSIRKLDFSPNGISTIVHVNDLKNSPGPGKWELRQATNHALQLFQDNYPEFVAKQVFVNVPWWYLAVNRMISPFLTHRTKSKFVFAGTSRSADTLFRYVSPEQVPVRYGGLKKDDEQEFSTIDAVTEITLKPQSKYTVEIPASSEVVSGVSVVWEIRVLGWEVCYGAEFVPAGEGYTLIVQKARKLGPTDEALISDGYKIGEVGKIVLTIDNQTSKKKKLLYRYKTKTSSD